MKEDKASIHPLAIAVGVLGLLILLIIVTASSHQREKLQYLAKKAFRKKRSELNPNGGTEPQDVGSLPSFAKNAADTGNIRMLQRWVSSHAPDINARSKENLTALHYASRGGHTECMR